MQFFKGNTVDWVTALRKRSKKEWRKLGTEVQHNSRIWLQEHGELSLVAGILAGILVVLAFRLFLVLSIIAIAFGILLWVIAPNEPSTIDRDTDNKTP